MRCPCTCHRALPITALPITAVTAWLFVTACERHRRAGVVAFLAGADCCFRPEMWYAGCCHQIGMGREWSSKDLASSVIVQASCNSHGNYTNSRSPFIEVLIKFRRNYFELSAKSKNYSFVHCQPQVTQSGTILPIF